MDQDTLVRNKANVVATDDVVGKKVINNEHEKLGKIYQIILDKASGQTVYLILESDSFLGLGGKLIPLPWNAIHYDANEEAFILNISKEKLQNAPNFDKSQALNLGDESYSDSIFKYFGTKSYFNNQR